MRGNERFKTTGKLQRTSTAVVSGRGRRPYAQWTIWNPCCLTAPSCWAVSMTASDSTRLWIRYSATWSQPGVSQSPGKRATVEYLKSYYDKGFLVQAAGGSESRPLLLSYHVRHPHSVRPWNTSSFSWHTILSPSCVTSSKCPKRFTPRIVARIAVFRYK